jgi:hypothetical protein
LLAFLGDLAAAGIGGHPLRDAVIWEFHDIVLWTIVGLVVAGRVPPVTAPAG